MDFKPYLQEISLRKDAIESTDHFPFNIPAIREMPVIRFHEDVTFIVGENGSGKSTFIEAVAQFLGLSKEGGSEHTTQIESKPDSMLFKYLQGSRSYRRPRESFFLRAESLYNVATYLENVYEHEKDKFKKIYGVDSLHECSHGESFLAIMANRLGGNGLYIFDEPEAALSPTRQLSALSLIDGLVRKNSQFIIATHSPILLAYPNASIYQFDENGIRKITYEESEIFTVTRSFLNNHQYMVERLMSSNHDSPA
jgi:predicted ATPase